MNRININPLYFLDNNNTKFYVGDIISYPNKNIKSIICFGFYDNSDTYEDYTYGCGFYLLEVNNINNEWKIYNDEVRHISKDDIFTKETDVKTLLEITNTYNNSINH
jgi:hypothetical protein